MPGTASERVPPDQTRGAAHFETSTVVHVRVAQKKTGDAFSKYSRGGKEAPLV